MQVVCPPVCDNFDCCFRQEEYVEEECMCKCPPKRCNCKCECEDCDKDWEPGIDTEDDSEDTDTDYDSDDSMDDIYEECGLTREEKKILQDELDYLIKQAEDCCPNCVEKKSIQPEVPEPSPPQK